jgi:hypothetical protein
MTNVPTKILRVIVFSLVPKNLNGQPEISG